MRFNRQTTFNMVDTDYMAEEGRHCIRHGVEVRCRKVMTLFRRELRHRPINGRGLLSMSDLLAHFAPDYTYGDILTVVKKLSDNYILTGVRAPGNTNIGAYALSPGGNALWEALYPPRNR